MLETKSDLLEKKHNKLEYADSYYRLLNECIDQLEYWLSCLQQEIIDSHVCDERIGSLLDDFRELDIEFKKANSLDWNNFQFGAKGKIRKTAKLVRTEQRKEAIREYKPEPGRADITIMAEVAATNNGKNVDVYIVSEDGHFCSRKNRELLENKYCLHCCYAHEILQDRLIRELFPEAWQNN